MFFVLNIGLTMTYLHDYQFDNYFLLVSLPAYPNGQLLQRTA